MTLVILTILVLAYVLIATENVTKVNRAAVAIFAGTVVQGDGKHSHYSVAEGDALQDSPDSEVGKV